MPVRSPFSALTAVLLGFVFALIIGGLNFSVMGQVQPIYETMPGWSEDVTGVRAFDELPANAKAYIEHIETLTGVPVSMISVGPEREQLIVR